MSENEAFMREAIRLAIHNVRSGAGGPFGALVVRAGDVVGRGANRVVAGHDPTAHAEVAAIRDACARLGTHRLDGCDLYASCEPCPMCLGAAYWARVDRLFHAATRHDAAEAGFDDERILSELGLPAERRSLPTVQLLREPSLAAFREWRERSDRVPY